MLHSVLTLETRRSAIASAIILATLLFFVVFPFPVIAQQPTSTPVPVSLPSATPTNPPPTDTPTVTPTSQGPAVVEALTAQTNVRSQPDINSERVGQISPGQTFGVIGRYFEWLQINYPDNPSGSNIGWVHQSVVQVIGDEALIPNLAADEIPTENPVVLSERETQLAITATPGIFQTLTMQAFITPTGLFTVEGQPGSTDPLAGTPQPGILPTFTFPPFTDTPLPIADLTVPRTVVDSGGLPPIAPIMGLIGLGGIGLLISLLRRG